MNKEVIKKCIVDKTFLLLKYIAKSPNLKQFSLKIDVATRLSISITVITTQYFDSGKSKIMILG